MILTLSYVYYKTEKGEISTHFERKNLTLMRENIENKKRSASKIFR